MKCESASVDRQQPLYALHFTVLNSMSLYESKTKQQHPHFAYGKYATIARYSRGECFKNFDLENRVCCRELDATARLGFRRIEREHFKERYRYFVNNLIQIKFQILKLLLFVCDFVHSRGSLVWNRPKAIDFNSHQHQYSSRSQTGSGKGKKKKKKNK